MSEDRLRGAVEALRARWRLPSYQFDAPGADWADELDAVITANTPPHDGHSARLIGLLADCPGCASGKPTEPPTEGATMSNINGVDLIAAERYRQVEVEGYTPEHDQQHAGEELAIAAMCYLLPEYRDEWPWSADAYKPGSRLRDLIKAGALIAAEIDRKMAGRDHR